jgi:hypothetical protein
MIGDTMSRLGYLIFTDLADSLSRVNEQALKIGGRGAADNNTSLPFESSDKGTVRNRFSSKETGLEYSSKYWPIKYSRKNALFCAIFYRLNALTR